MPSNFIITVFFFLDTKITPKLIKDSDLDRPRRARILKIGCVPVKTIRRANADLENVAPANESGGNTQHQTTVTFVQLTKRVPLLEKPGDAHGEQLLLLLSSPPFCPENFSRLEEKSFSKLPPSAMRLSTTLIAKPRLLPRSPAIRTFTTSPRVSLPTALHRAQRASDLKAHPESATTQEKLPDKVHNRHWSEEKATQSEADVSKNPTTTTMLFLEFWWLPVLAVLMAWTTTIQETNKSLEL